MNPSAGLLSRLRSGALLLAGLLHLLSIPAEPLVHGWVHAPPAERGGWVAPDPDAGGTQLHQELVCVVCQGINEHAAPEPGAQPVPDAETQVAASAPSFIPVHSAARLTLQARAPPV